MMTNRTRKRSETPVEKERRLSEELDQSKAENRKPEFEEEDVTMVTRLLEERHSRITELGCRRISAGFRRPSKGPTTTIRRT